MNNDAENEHHQPRTKKIRPRTKETINFCKYIVDEEGLNYSNAPGLAARMQMRREAPKNDQVQTRE